MSDTCKGCNAEITWAVTETGKAIPLDPEPIADGNLALATLDVGGPMVVHYIQKGETVAPLVPRYRAHFTSCPNAGEFRKAKGDKRNGGKNGGESDVDGDVGCRSGGRRERVDG